MDNFRDMFGYVLGLAFCAAGLVLCWFAWTGLEHEYGWQWSLAGVALSILIRINFPLIVGLFLYAHNIWGWDTATSVAFATPGLLLLLPSVAIEVFSLLVGSTGRR